MSRTLESALHELREMWLNFPGLSFGSLSRSCIQEMSPEQADFYEQACKVALAASPGPSELVERPNPETQAVYQITHRASIGADSGWMDCDKEAYDNAADWDRRIIYLSSRAPVEAVPVAKLMELEAELRYFADNGIPLVRAHWCADRLSALITRHRGKS